MGQFERPFCAHLGRSADDRSASEAYVEVTSPFGCCGRIAFVRRRTIRTKIQRTFIRRMSVHLVGSLGRLASHFQAVGICMHSISGTSNRVHAEITPDLEARTPSAAPVLGGAEGKRLPTQPRPIGTRTGDMTRVSHAPVLILTAPDALAPRIAMAVRTAIAQRERRRSRR